jgi:hypothetical protein
LTGVVLVELNDVLPELEMGPDELLPEHVQVDPSALSITTTTITSFIRSMHGVADSEQVPGQAAREEAPDVAFLILPM